MAKPTKPAAKPVEPSRIDPLTNARVSDEMPEGDREANLKDARETAKRNHDAEA